MNYFYCSGASKKEQLSTLDCSHVKAERAQGTAKTKAPG